MPKRILATILLIFLCAATFAQNATLPVPTDLKAVLVPTMSPLPVIGLRWTAPDGPWKYRVFRSEGDSLHFHLLGLASSRAYFDPVSTGPNTYFYQVRTAAGVDSQIVESGPSNTAWLTIGPLPPRPTGTIAGTVGDDGTHLPIPFAIVRFFRLGANITIYPPPMALADSLGRYRAVLDTGMYLVRADGIGIPTFSAVLYRPEWYDNVTDISQATPVPVTPGSQFTANFSLTRLLPPKVVTIEGTVTNDVGNTEQPTVPLAGATVAILRPIQAMDSPGILPASSAVAGGDGADVVGLGYCAGIVW